MIAHTVDTVYDGRVTLYQPERGFRAGIDSLLLAAALPAPAGTEALEIGCGCGGALLPAASRLTGTAFTGLEIDPDIAVLAEAGVQANGVADRVRIATGDASAWVKAHENRFGLVFANPPYFEAGRISPPGAGRKAAYVETLDLGDWVRAMAFAARPRAPLVMVHRAADLARILTALDRVAGEITVLPVETTPGEDAKRVLVRGRKGLRRGPVRLMSPVTLHAPGGGPSAASAAINRGDALDWSARADFPLNAAGPGPFEG